MRLYFRGGQITACSLFFVHLQVRMAFTFLKSCKNNKETGTEYVAGNVQSIYYLSRD